jgi:tRNA modification GTPase
VIVIHSPDDPIAALATPAASSALAVIRVSGPGSLELLSPLVAHYPEPAAARRIDHALSGRFDPAAASGHTIHRCVLKDGNEDVDEVLLAVYKSPKSYTGEDSAEIFCHGSLPVIRRLLSLLARSGFRAAGPGEFTQRAFLNGRMGLTQAEAVNEIVRARTDKARGLALQRLGGAVETRIGLAREALLDLRASLEVLIDYPDEMPEGGLDMAKLEEAGHILQELVSTYRQGRVYQAGVAIAIAGATNAGKSSLFNLLLRQDRAMVSEIHGTTRDWLESSASVDGVPVRLFDTAGLRTSTDPLEIEGMRKTREVITAADVVVYLVDGTRGMDAADREFIDGWEGAASLLRVWNKTDLAEVLPAPGGFLPVSAMSGAGIDELQRALAAAALGGATVEASEPLIDSERQRDLLTRALAGLQRLRDALSKGVTPDLLAVDLAEAMDPLGEISGTVTSAEILDRMFSRFCVGK